MADLSRASSRRPAQSRITNNRDAILPTRRLDQRPDVVVAADLRSAYRGDRAAETRRALGLVDDTAETFAQIDAQGSALRAPGERAKGALDAASGAEVDPALARSRAYSSTYYSAKAEAELTTWSAGTGTSIQDVIDGGGTPEDVREALTKSVTELRDRVADDYPSAEAQHALGVGLLKFTSELDAKVAAQFKDRADTELLNNTSFNLVNRVDTGEDVGPAFEASIGNLKAAGIDTKRAKAALVSSVVLWGTNPEDPHADELLAFANAARADGTPSLSPEERQTLQNAAITAKGFETRKANEDRKAAQAVVEDKLYADITSGRDVSADIDAAFQKDVFTAEEALAWRTRNRTEVDRLEKGEANAGLVNDLEMALLSGASPATIRARATRAYNSGSLGTGTAAGDAYVSLLRSTKESSSTGKASNKAEGVAARGYLNDVLRPDSDDLRGNAAVSGQYRSAQVALVKKIDGGMDPMEAAEAVVTEYGPKIDAALKRRAPTIRPGSPAPGAQRPSQTKPPPANNDAALARIRQLAAERRAKEAALKR